MPSTRESPAWTPVQTTTSPNRSTWASSWRGFAPASAAAGSRSRRPLIAIGGLEINRRQRYVSRDGQRILLTAREYALLEYLALRAGEVVGRATIAEHVWDATHEGASNVIDVCVQRLRRKIDEPGQPSLIVTRRAEGYMLTTTPAQESR